MLKLEGEVKKERTTLRRGKVTRRQKGKLTDSGTIMGRRKRATSIESRK